MARKFSGARLRAARLTAGLRPEQLAIGIGRSAYSVYQYERGVALPSAPVLGALADTLSCRIDDFYTAEAVTVDAAA